MLAFIWAQDESGTIGLDGRLPWYLPDDLRYFKGKTLNQVVVMGRKTFEGMGRKPLPNRKNIILTTDLDYQAENVLLMHSKEEVLNFANQYEGTVYITGGANVYRLFLDDADILYRTLITGQFEGDTQFPQVDWENWQKTDSIVGKLDEKNKYPHVFETYRKKTT